MAKLAEPLMTGGGLLLTMSYARAIRSLRHRTCSAWPATFCWRGLGLLGYARSAPPPIRGNRHPSGRRHTPDEGWACYAIPGRSSDVPWGPGCPLDAPRLEPHSRPRGMCPPSGRRRWAYYTIGDLLPSNEEIGEDRSGVGHVSALKE